MKYKFTLAITLLLGIASIDVQAHRIHVRDDDPDEIELNGTALKNQQDVSVYSNTFLKEGKSIKKINQEEEDRKNGDGMDQGKAVEEITKSVSMNKISNNRAPMIQRANSNPTHIDIQVPTMPSKPKKK